MIETATERRARVREIINFPARLSFDGIIGLHPCVVRNISASGACLSTPYYLFASNFELSFRSFDRTIGCRVVWRRGTLCGVVFVPCAEYQNEFAEKPRLQKTFDTIDATPPPS